MGKIYLLGFHDQEESQFYFLRVNKDSVAKDALQLLTHNNKKVQGWAKTELNKLDFSTDWQRSYKEKQLRVLFVPDTPENERAFEVIILECKVEKILRDFNTRSVKRKQAKKLP